MCVWQTRYETIISHCLRSASIECVSLSLFSCHFDTFGMIPQGGESSFVWKSLSGCCLSCCRRFFLDTLEKCSQDGAIWDVYPVVHFFSLDLVRYYHDVLCHHSSVYFSQYFMHSDNHFLQNFQSSEPRSNLYFVSCAILCERVISIKFCDENVQGN